VNSQIFTHIHEIFFFYRYGGQKTLKIASHRLFHKKSFIFPIRGGSTPNGLPCLDGTFLDGFFVTFLWSLFLKKGNPLPYNPALPKVGDASPQADAEKKLGAY
jgi:hypothetical protein